MDLAVILACSRSVCGWPERVRVALHGARVDGHPGGVLVADKAQLERVVCIDARGVGCDGGGAQGPGRSGELGAGQLLPCCTCSAMHYRGNRAGRAMVC